MLYQSSTVFLATTTTTMTSQAYALPPGVYTIVQANNTTNQGVTDAAQGETLSFTSLNSTNGPNSPDQQWLINGSGVIRARESARFTYVNSYATRQNIRSGGPPGNRTEWIIGNITWNTAGYYTGYIRASEKTAGGSVAVVLINA
ncbi:hypothetical protein D9757_010713 [Collybiopsis confluens]|uniref:Uncharacterized protein n=1 Tax=Collybiopsis confluens TaxID=2823264 RepID=A0A8H5GZR6_9AGAR|nr:hypothetical protein D9757_010713 [Collybiopsis confluens]